MSIPTNPTEQEQIDFLADKILDHELRIAALEGKPTPEPPDPVPSKFDANGVWLSPVAAVITAGAYKLSATVETNKSVTFTFLQIAVRGATDVGHSAGTVVNTTTRTVEGAGDLLAGGTITVFLAYSLDGATWFNGSSSTLVVPPAPPAPVDPPPTTGRRIPFVGRSGLRFNSVVFRFSPADADAFGTRRNRPVDGFLMFNNRTAGWNGFRQFDVAAFRQWLEAKRLIIYRTPHAPQTGDRSMNSKGANNAYANDQKAFGQWIANNGLNSPYFVHSVDWEHNGSWYDWSAMNGGPDALKGAITNYVKNLRAGGATNLTFGMCWNKGPSQSGPSADYSMFPGGEYIDVIGSDTYDQWNPSFTDVQWDAEIRKAPGLYPHIQFAKANGVMWSLDEGGNTWPQDANHGGDNPFYWKKMFELLNTESTTCAWHNTYDDPGAPPTLKHDFNSNPKSWAYYKSTWGKV
jgi:hypothetical protein